MSERIAAAMAAYKQAACAAIEAVKAAYPVGTVVEVSIGRSTFLACIERREESWWVNPGRWSELTCIQVNSNAFPLTA